MLELGLLLVPLLNRLVAAAIVAAAGTQRGLLACLRFTALECKNKIGKIEIRTFQLICPLEGSIVAVDAVVLSSNIEISSSIPLR